MSGFEVITYAPWQPREGMKRTYVDLVQAWGSPESGRWPVAVRDVVCERGAPIPLAYDRHAVANCSWFYAGRARLA